MLACNGLISIWKVEADQRFSYSHNYIRNPSPEQALLGHGSTKKGPAKSFRPMCPP
jgi:hypothetical protein